MATRRATGLQAAAQSTRAKAKPAAKRYKPTPTDLSDREHLIAVIQEASGGSKSTARETLDALIGTVTASLKKNLKVQLTGFGSFHVVTRAARTGRNPRTGETVKIKRSKSVRFKPGQTLKGAV